eukprot:29614-Pelagococcus_subviridis.AAC.8
MYANTSTNQYPVSDPSTNGIGDSPPRRPSSGLDPSGGRQTAIPTAASSAARAAEARRRSAAAGMDDATAVAATRRDAMEEEGDDVDAMIASGSIDRVRVVAATRGVVARARTGIGRPRGARRRVCDGDGEVAAEAMTRDRATATAADLSC